MMRDPAPFAVIGLALALGGCVSLKRTPEARFFVLRSLAEGEPGPAGGPRGGLVGVLPTRLAGHLDRPQVVTWTALNELRIDEFTRWAEPLETGVTRTLAENLAALLPEHPVLRYPLPVSVQPGIRVLVELRVFGVESDGVVRLEGRFALLPARADRPLARGPLSLRRSPPAGTATVVDPGVAVEAMNELLAQASREIAGAVRGLPEEAASPLR